MMQISPMLAVSNGKAAIDFYLTAFGAELLRRVEVRRARRRKRMLQGSVIDPSGHMWLIGKILE